jgi:beta-phosphoglucomutase-like phosphatase (HAD superfamily)
MRDLQLVIFDCDGVLVDSEVISNDVLARSLTAEGLPTTLAEARRDYQDCCWPMSSRERRRSSGARSPRIGLSDSNAIAPRCFHRELQPVPGAAEAVQRISAAGVAVCVASQGKAEKTKLSLGLTGMRHLFPGAALFSAYSVPRGKPHPDLFLHAAAVMEAKPTRCAVVEDTASGVTAAVAAGMRTLGYVADSDEAAGRRRGAALVGGSAGAAGIGLTSPSSGSSWWATWGWR